MEAGWLFLALRCPLLLVAAEVAQGFFNASAAEGCGAAAGGSSAGGDQELPPPAAPQAPSQRVLGEPSAPGTAAGIGT